MDSNNFHLQQNNIHKQNRCLVQIIDLEEEESKIEQNNKNNNNFNNNHYNNSNFQKQNNNYIISNVIEIDDDSVQEYFQNNISNQEPYSNSNNDAQTIIISDENEFDSSQTILNKSQNFQVCDNTILDLNNSIDSEQSVIEISSNNNSFLIESSQQVFFLEEEKTDKNVTQSIISNNRKRNLKEMYDQEVFNLESEDTGSEELDDKIVKKQGKKIKKQKIEIEGPFQLQGFSWKEDQRINKKYLQKDENKKAQQNDFFKGTDFMNNMQKNKQKGIDVHLGIEMYLKYQNKKRLQSFLNEKQAELIFDQVDTTIQYLKLRGMNQFEVEIKISNEQLNKKIDYLAYNNETKECIIVDWKFSKSRVNDLIKSNESHFQQQLMAVEDYFENKYKITLLVIPLKNIDKLQFIEYTEDDVGDVQSSQLELKTFQKKKIQYLKTNRYYENFLNYKCSLKNYKCNKTLLELAQTFIKENQQENIEYFKNLNNSVYEFYINEQTNYKKISRIDQFYIIHLILTSLLS